MNKTEPNTPFIHLRFLIVIMIALVCMFFDMRTKLLNDLRYYVESALYPILSFANSPHSLTHIMSQQFKSHTDLMNENEKLAAENYMLRVNMMRLEALESENNAMRKLLNSPQRDASKRIFAEIVNVDSNPYLKRVVVDRGSSSGIYSGMPVMSDTGLVGQVISVNYAFSRVLLITDPNCAVPVMDQRSFVRAIATGNGSQHEILINNVPRSSDVQVGDKIFTSGLGGVYPAGYPVAEVTSVGFSESQPFALIKARPMVDLDRMRHVLMYWYQDPTGTAQSSAPPKERTDNKFILRQQRVRNLIESLSPENVEADKRKQAERASGAAAPAAPQ